MFISIVNDCRDDNAAGRQVSRVSSLTGVTPAFVGVSSDLEAGMNLIDILDATEGRKGLVLVNVAPRGGPARKWENGTPFGYFKHKDTIVVSSIDGLVLSAVIQLGLIEELFVFDTKETSEALLKHRLIDEKTAAYIPKSQFRSFDFTPRVGHALLEGYELPGEQTSLDFVPSLPKAIWTIDSFGNAKTTLTEDDLSKAETETKFGTFKYYHSLKDLPDNETGLVLGSSGFGETRFLELMTQRGSFTERYNVSSGHDLLPI